jgi:nicotinamide mononucleotide (NMN) deamidase PncC
MCAAARHERGTETIAELQHFPGDRAAVRRASVQRALELLLRLDLRTATA